LGNYREHTILIHRGESCTMTAYKSPVQLEFTRRTLEILKNQVDNSFDVTMLINLCIGLLTIPNEYAKTREKEIEIYFKQLNITPDIFTVFNKNFPVFVGDFIEYPEKRKYRNVDKAKYLDFIRFLGNGISHGNIELIGDPIIELVQIKNYPMGSSTPNFSKIFTIEQFKEITIFIAELHIKYYKDIEKI
jgi:hypothetical protein